MPEIQQLNSTTLEVAMPSGDKVEIGDREAVDFKPHLKLNRWGGECFIKVGLPTAEKITPIIEAGRVKWRGQKVEACFYPLEPRTVIVKDKSGRDVPFTQNELGGFEFEVILKKKPKTNKIVLNLETQGLKFYYQPELTPKEIAEGSVRPDNVVGSYAVYHAARGNMHRGKATAEKYKCGKAFHICRPKITDAEGKWVWGELNLNEQAGTLTTTIPQDFLGTAVYPVSIDPNFGYEVGGSTYSNVFQDTVHASLHTSPVDVGTATSISAYGMDSGDQFKGLIILHNGLTIIENGIGNAVALDATYSWKTSIFATPPSLSPSIEYLLGIIAGIGLKLKRDGGAADQSHVDSSNSFASPQDLGTITHGNYKYSIYCTYEEAPAVVAPTVTTQAVDNIGTTTGRGNGNQTDNGGEDASAWGVCYNTTGNPTTADSVAAGSGAGGVGAFTAAMSGLTPGQHYYVKAYATNSAGTGYGGQVEFTTNKDCTGSETGSGVDAKASGNPLATYARSETGGGVDGHKAVAPQSVGEAGFGVDALTALLGILARSETGLGTDAKLSLLAALVKADSGSGVEHILDRALVLTEVGSGVDIVLSLLGKLVTESGTGAENSYLHILEGVKDSSDSGSGAEASSLTTLLQRGETGEGVESVVARALYAREYPTGALDLAKVLTAVITGDETGTGAEASLMAYYQKKADSGEGVDSSTLEAMFTGEDSGAGAEAITLLAAMVSHDTGVGVETVIEYFRKLIDSGEGEENLHLIGFVGRAMKLITYLRAYSDMAVYTRPYSELTVYTSETKL